MFGWFKKKAPPPGPKQCAQCGTAMDADETVCPQCGHGLQEQAERRARRQAQTQAPCIDMSDLTPQWARMRFAERRQVMQARMGGTDRTLFARMAKKLGLAARHEPPSARRVAARALVLSTVVCRAYLEMNLKDMPPESWEPQRRHVLDWLEGLGIARELEPHERSFLQAPCGHVDGQLVTNAAWRGEGLAVLAWALNRFGLPSYDEETFPPDLAQESVGFLDARAAREFLDSAVLRPVAALERFATHATVVTWRLRQFRMSPGPLDFVGYLRRHASFREAWLEGLNIVDGDLALSAQAIAQADAEKVQTCERIALERQIAAYWLEGDARVYSNVNPTTLLTAC
jgi:hypothetical protein